MTEQPAPVDQTLERWGSNIRSAREALGIGQYDFADRMGVRQPTVWRWEKGLMEPTRTNKARLAELLGIKVEELFPLGAETAA